MPPTASRTIIVGRAARARVVQAWLLGALIATPTTAPSLFAESCPTRLEPQLAPQAARQTDDAMVEHQARDASGKLPMVFEENRGQTDARVQYFARGRGYSLFLTSAAAVLVSAVQLDVGDDAAGTPDASQLSRPRDDRAGLAEPSMRRAALRMNFVGADPAARVVGERELESKSNYLIGNDPSVWRKGVPSFARVRYSGVYPGVDAVYYDNAGQLEYDLVLAPGADPRAIAMRFEGTDRIRVTSSGELVLETVAGDVRQSPPIVYQEAGGRRVRVAGAYSVRDANEVGFTLDSYDERLPLVIDPAFIGASLIGGNLADSSRGVALDASGAVYVAGSTLSVDFPTHNGFDPELNGSTDTFVMKLSPALDSLVYSTYFGGSGSENNRGLAVDLQGAVMISGVTDSADIPTVNAIDSLLNANGEGGANDTYIAKLDATGGTLVYSTYLGGSAGDESRAIAADSNGAAYIAGLTSSADFPVSGSLFGARGGIDAFVTKLSPAGAIVFSTELGGSGYDVPTCVAVRGAEEVYVAGVTVSRDFPMVNALQPSYGGDDGWGDGDGFLARLSASGDALRYATYLGGRSGDTVFGVVADDSGAAVLSGETLSRDFPTTTGGTGGPHDGFSEVFVSKVSASGDALVFSRFLGGRAVDVGGPIGLLPTGEVVVAGRTLSPDFPATGPRIGPPDRAGDSGGDGFVAKLDPTGASVLSATVFGGSRADGSSGLALAPTGIVYIAGNTDSPDFPTVNPFDPAHQPALSEGFVARIDLDAVTPPLVSGIQVLEGAGKPLRVKITGSNLQSGLQVYIDGDTTAWPGAKLKKGTTLVLKGAGLADRLPPGVPVSIRLANPDGGEASVSVTR